MTIPFRFNISSVAPIQHVLVVGTTMTRNGITYEVKGHEPFIGAKNERPLYDVLVVRPDTRRKRVLMTLEDWNLRAQQLEAL